MAWVVAFILVFFYQIASFASPVQEDLRTAFYYGNKPPVQKLRLFKNIVVQPNSGLDLSKLQSSQHQVFAYVSLGEVAKKASISREIDSHWVRAVNKDWNSLVLDQSNPGWQKFFLSRIIKPLWNQGYRGFFLDTLDSYRLIGENPKEIKKQQQGLIATIRMIKTTYPDAKIILNRGFEILPEIKPLVDEVVAESLFHGWNNPKKAYVTVSKQDRASLLKELAKAKAMGLPITIIDYMPGTNMEAVQKNIQAIRKLGFNPWIADGDLTAIYVINGKPYPRKILCFYQGKVGSLDEKLGSFIASAVLMPLDYLGYVTELQNINEPLPSDISPEEYAGIVLDIRGILKGREEELYAWYRSQMSKKIPIVVLNQFGFTLDNKKLQPFDMSMPLFDYPPQSLKIIYQSPIIGYEMAPILNKNEFIGLFLNKGEGLFKVASDTGVFDMAGITSWGGYFLTSGYLIPLLHGNYRWVINPFVFFKRALRLKDMPAPDVTTENGRRLMFVHVDGDGFANRAGWHQGDYASLILSQEIFERYAIPTTVSIIQGEIAPNGLYPKESPVLEKIARKIFALPYVEIGSHTFSHPFVWDLAEVNDYRKGAINPYNLPIPGYLFNVQTEVEGSVNYINSQLAPKDKKCKMFLWSGEGNVSAKVLGMVYNLGIGNINPGRLMNDYNKSLSAILPLGLSSGPYFQVFAPINNDKESIGDTNVFYALISIMDALKFTDAPRRLKPLNIYLHFYEVTQKGGVKALKELYDWALAQPVMNIYASEYFSKVIDFRQLLLFKKEDGWLFQTQDELREIRIPKSQGYPDLGRSRNVIGYNSHNGDNYLHLGPGGESLVYFTKDKPTLPYLIEANARITRFEREKDKKDIHFSLKGHQPLRFAFANMQGCRLWQVDPAVKPRDVGAMERQDVGAKHFAFEKETHGDFAIRCH